MRKEIIVSPDQFIILTEADQGNCISVLSVYDIKKKKKRIDNVSECRNKLDTVQ